MTDILTRLSTALAVKAAGGGTQRDLSVAISSRSPSGRTKVRPALGWPIEPDGRFLIQKIAKGGEHRSLKVILNWGSTLNDLSRTAK